MEADHGLRQLEKGLKLLALLGKRDEVSIVQLAAYLDLPVTSVDDILLTLQGQGYVKRMANGASVRLTTKSCAPHLVDCVGTLPEAYRDPQTEIDSRMAPVLAASGPPRVSRTTR